MSDPRAELADREDAAWEAFEAAVHGVPRARWEDDGVLPGWSVKDVLAHVIGWLERCSDQLEALREGTYVEHDLPDDEVHAMNERFVAAMRDRDADVVWSHVLTARRRLLDQWRTLPEIDERAADRFGTETFEHYEEHVPELERFTR
jgi:hypothetical protein